MSDRVPATLTTGTASPGLTGPRSGRHVIVGQTGLGPATGPLVVRSLTEYTALYGPRTAGSAMYDAAEFYLDNRAGELVVMRATGPTAAKATVGLESGDIVVTAKHPGASYNSWTAAYTSATTTLTLVKGATTVSYVGATAAALQTAAEVDRDVTVTVTALPSADVAATALASGTDDFANVVWATTLGLVPASFGPGTIAIPGVAYGTASAGTALAAHAKTTGRLALLSVANGQTRAQAVTAMTTIAALTGAENAVLVWNEAGVPSGSAGTKTIDPTTVAAALRGHAHRLAGPGTNPIRRDVAAKLTTPITLANSVSSADFTALVAAHVSFLRVLADGSVGLDNWQTAASPNANLFGAQFRDIANCAADAVATVLERFAGWPGSALTLTQVQAEVEGVLDAYRPWLYPAYGADGTLQHPGYRVTVSNGASLTDNRITVAVALRLTESADFFDFTLSTSDAASVI